MKDTNIKQRGEQAALEMLQAKLTCMKLDDLRCVEKGCSRNCEACDYNYAQGTRGEQKDALGIAVKALAEIQQYRKLGTPEELRALKEKQIPKRPVILNRQSDGIKKDMFQGIYYCPACKKGMFQGLTESKGNCCKNCGQALDWNVLSGTD